MTRNAETSEGCTLLRLLLRMFDCGTPDPPVRPPRFALIGFGRPEDPDNPNPPTEYLFMAKGNIGQRIPINFQFLQTDGVTPATIDGEPTYETDDGAVCEVRIINDKPYAYLLAEGSTAGRIIGDADRGDGVRPVIGVFLIIVNDPATEATSVEVTLGPAEDVPVDGDEPTA